jgi:hypothetical protein
MNNFFELQATDIFLNLVLELEPHYKIHAPDIQVRVNHIQLYSGKLTHACQLTHQIPLLSTFDIQIQLTNKNNLEDNTTAALITQLSIDNHQLVPTWTQMAQYSNDHNYQQPTTHLGFNGVWKLSINRPFYQWWHVVTGQGWLLEPKI